MRLLYIFVASISLVSMCASQGMKNTGKLKDKTVLLMGSSRGIGLAIAKKIAADGANIIIAARTTEPTSETEETIFTAATEIENAGGRSLPCKVDVQNVDDIRAAIQKGVDKFAGIDIVINVAGTFYATPMLATDIDKLDLMYKTIVRAAFATCKLCHPYLKNSTHAHILNISPPLNLDRVWMKRHMAHTAAKYSMSMYTLGMAEEFRDDKIAANSVWPKTVIYSTGMKKRGPKAKKYCRSVDIVADAAYAILIKDPASYTGNLEFDEDILKAEQITDFEQYRADKCSTEKLFPDIFTDQVPNFDVLN